MPQLDDVSQRITDALLALARDAKSRGSLFHPSPWTREIKELLWRLGKEFNFCVSANGCQANSEQWLYDVTWSKMTEHCRGFLLSIPLVAEIEWSPDPHVDGDFQKLVQSRAGLRLWVFVDEGLDEIRKKMQAYREQISQFEASQPGDRYLLAAFVRTSLELEICPHVHGA